MSNLSRLHTPRNPELLKELGYTDKEGEDQGSVDATVTETATEPYPRKKRAASVPSKEAGGMSGEWTPKPIVEDTLTRKIRVSGHFTKQERADIRIAAAKLHLTGVDEFVRMAVLAAVRNCDQLQG